MPPLNLVVIFFGIHVLNLIYSYAKNSRQLKHILIYLCNIIIAFNVVFIIISSYLTLKC